MMTRQVGRVTDDPTTQSVVIADFAPAVVAAADPRIQQYEKLLASCHTESAAGYLIERILALMPKRKGDCANPAKTITPPYYRIPGAGRTRSELPRRRASELPQ